MVMHYTCIPVRQVSGTEFFTAVVEDGGEGPLEEIVPIIRGGCLRNKQLADN